MPHVDTFRSSVHALPGIVHSFMMAKEKRSEILSVVDHQPEGFRWLTLKRIKVGLYAELSRPSTVFTINDCSQSADIAFFPVLQYKDPTGRSALSLVKRSMEREGTYASCIFYESFRRYYCTLLYRERQWESAERVSRHGAVDGVAIIAQVYLMICLSHDLFFMYN